MTCFFFSSRRRHTRCSRDWSSDVCSSDLAPAIGYRFRAAQDRIVDGRALVTDRSDRHAKRRLWRVVTGADPRGTRGMAGDLRGLTGPKKKSHDVLERVGLESSPPSPPSPANPEGRYGV